MGYTTEFEGSCQFDTPLTQSQVAYIHAFSRTRRMKRDESLVSLLSDPLRNSVGLPIGCEGEYYVGDEGLFPGEKGIIDCNCPAATQPGLWCGWTVSVDGTTFEWDGCEKFYSYIEWLHYMIDNFFAPWGKHMSGIITWEGEDERDTGTIRINSNHVNVEYSDEAVTQYWAQIYRCL